MPSARERSRVVASGGPALTAALRVGWGPGFVYALTGVLGSCVLLIMPTAIGRSVDALLAGEPSPWPAVTATLLLVSALADGAGTWAGGVWSARRTAHHIALLVRHALAAGPRLTQRMSVAEVVTRATANAPQAAGVPMLVLALATTLLPAVGAALALFWIDVWCGLAFVVVLVVFLVLLRLLAGQAAALTAPYLAAQGEIATHLGEALRGARTVAAAGTEPAERTRILAPLAQLRLHGRAFWQLQAVSTRRVGSLMPMLAFAVVAVGGWQLTAGRLTIGELTAVIGYVSLAILLPAALGTVAALGQARAAAGRCAELLAVPAVPYGRSDHPIKSGEIRFVDVHANTDGFPALRGIDVRIVAGQHVALVGGEAAGTALFTAVLARLVDTDLGTVLLDDVPIGELSAATVHGALGFAFARPALLGHTLAGSIALGKARPEPGAVVAAARDAHADAFITRLPAGYLTALADAPMSGGEAQRLGLARAFAHPGQVLVLEDATSSLDTVTEHQIMQAMSSGRPRTRLVTTVRASSAARADRVLWFEDGRIRGDATHAQLWSDPAYRAVFAAAAQRESAEQDPGR